MGIHGLINNKTWQESITTNCLRRLSPRLVYPESIMLMSLNISSQNVSSIKPALKACSKYLHRILLLHRKSNKERNKSMCHECFIVYILCTTEEHLPVAPGSLYFQEQCITSSSNKKLITRHGAISDSLYLIKTHDKLHVLVGYTLKEIPSTKNTSGSW